MLAHSQRITSADDYKRVVRRGRRTVGASCVSYQLMNPDGGTPRFGFIVAKTVGNAVIRNLVRRRLKAAAFGVSGRVPAGTEIVYRALPAAAGLSFSELRADVERSASRLVAS